MSWGSSEAMSGPGEALAVVGRMRRRSKEARRDPRPDRRVPGEAERPLPAPIAQARADRAGAGAPLPGLRRPGEQADGGELRPHPDARAESERGVALIPHGLGAASMDTGRLERRNATRSRTFRWNSSR